MNMINHYKNNGKAFSLIELLVALSILAVVAAIIVPRFLNVRGQAAATTAEAQRKIIQNAVQQFLALGGTWNGTNVGDLLTFLSSAPAAGNNSRGAANGCTDSAGNFSSGTIVLQMTPRSGVVNAVAGAAEGFYYAPGTDAAYIDGSGALNDIDIDANGVVTFN